MVKRQKYHILYKTTCTVTGNFYIGVHSSFSLQDGYLGSGIRLAVSIAKYGVENHTREILTFFESRENLMQAERELVTEEFISSNLQCLNLKPGGEGGFIDDEHQLKCTIAGSNNLQAKLQESAFREHFGKQIAKGNSGKPRNNSHLANLWKGRKMSQEQKDSIGRANSNKIGEKNSMFGKVWVYNDSVRISKPINKKDLSDFLANGWQSGRKRY